MAQSFFQTTSGSHLKTILVAFGNSERPHTTLHGLSKAQNGLQNYLRTTNFIWSCPEINLGGFLSLRGHARWHMTSPRLRQPPRHTTRKRFQSSLRGLRAIWRFGIRGRANSQMPNPPIKMSFLHSTSALDSTMKGKVPLSAWLGSIAFSFPPCQHLSSWHNNGVEQQLLDCIFIPAVLT